MIIGSFPIGKFSDPKRRKDILPHELDFFFGGERNLLWKLVGEAFGRELRAREDVISLLEEQGLAVGDVIASCRRKGGRASDSDLYDIVWNRELLSVIQRNRIKTLYFTSKGVMQWFHRLFPESDHKEVLLISPSAQSARSVVKRSDYLAWKKRHPEGRPRDFISVFYRRIFASE